VRDGGNQPWAPGQEVLLGSWVGVDLPIPRPRLGSSAASPVSGPSRCHPRWSRRKPGCMRLQQRHGATLGVGPGTRRLQELQLARISHGIW